MEQLRDHPVIRWVERTGYPRERKYTTCDWCGGDIRVGDEYYDVHGEILCFDFVQDCLRKAEIE